MNDGYDEMNKPIEEEWAMSDSDFHLKEKLKADGAEIPAATLYAPPDSLELEKDRINFDTGDLPIQLEAESRTISAPQADENTDVWKMPEPVFRSSEGKTPEKAKKRITNPDLPAARDEFSANSAFSTAAPPNIAEVFEINEFKSALKKEKLPERKTEKNRICFLHSADFF